MTPPIESPAALVPWTYDYWREGLCGTEPTAANIIAYNGEDVKAIGRVTNAGERADIIRKHNDVVRRLLATPAPAAGDSRGSGVVVPRDELERIIKVLRYTSHPSPSPHADALAEYLAAPAPPAVASGEAEISFLEKWLQYADEPVGAECCGRGKGEECCGDPEPVFRTLQELLSAMDRCHAELMARELAEGKK